MKKVLCLSLTVILLTTLASLTGLTGCESSSDDSNSAGINDLTVTPSAVNLTAGVVTNIQLTASKGSSNYTWTVDNPTLGTVVAAGATAIYTSTTNAGVNLVILTDTWTNSVQATVRQR